MTRAADTGSHPAVPALLSAAVSASGSTAALLCRRSDDGWHVDAVAGDVGVEVAVAAGTTLPSPGPSAGDLDDAREAVRAASGCEVPVAERIGAPDGPALVLLVVGPLRDRATAATVVRHLAAAITTLDEVSGGEHVLLRRTARGWHVDQVADPADDLVEAMALADLLLGDAPAGPRPPRREATDEIARLRTAVAQLEHALRARVVVEQAIGVLAERHGTTPRDAFERLRSASRSRGRKVRDLADLVVGSTTGRPEGLPRELH